MTDRQDPLSGRVIFLAPQLESVAKAFAAAEHNSDKLPRYHAALRRLTAARRKWEYRAAQEADRQRLSETLQR
jgi:hypothetical protein